MNSRYILLPYVSYILSTPKGEQSSEKIEVTSVKISRNEEKQRFDVSILAHKEVVKKFGVKDMTIQVQQVEGENSLHKFIIASKKNHRAEFFIEHELDKQDIEKIIKSMII